MRNIMKPVFIAAPFRAPTKDGEALNTRKAAYLASLAFDCWLTPYCPHVLELGDDQIPEERARILTATTSMARAIAITKGGCMWVLLNDDGTMSAGVREEFELWRTLTLVEPECHTLIGWAERAKLAEPYQPHYVCRKCSRVCFHKDFSITDKCTNCGASWQSMWLSLSGGDTA